MPQNDYMDEFEKKYGKKFDHERVQRKKLARAPKTLAKHEKSLHGLRAKLYHKKRQNEKIEMKKTIRMHEEKNSKNKEGEIVKGGAVPAYLLDRQETSHSKILSNAVKQKRKKRELENMQYHFLKLLRLVKPKCLK